MKLMNFRRVLLLTALLAITLTAVTGGTIAWFTDNVTSENNIIKAGNLDIELEYWNGQTWADVNGQSDILSNQLWEPGVTEVAYLRVKNAGSLALKYQLGVNIANETAGKNVAGEDFNLSEYIKFGVVEGVNGQTGAYAKDAAGRAAAISALTEAKKLSEGYSKQDSLAVSADKYMALVVYMPTDVGNEANHNGINVPQIDLGIKVEATQLAHENDSFDNQYDANIVESTKVATVKELNDAIQNAEDGDVIVLANDINLTETFNFNKNIELTLDLGGKKLTGDMHTLLKATAGTLHLKNGTIKNVNEAATETQYSVYLSGNAVADIKDVSIETSGTGIYLTDNAKITELSANVDSYMNANGNCTYDAVSLYGNARIDKIADGNYTSHYANEYIDEWNSTHSYSGIPSYPIRLNSSSATIGEISGGTFLGVADKNGSGSTIYVNSGTIELISKGYFGFYELSLMEGPDELLYVNSGNEASINQIKGGTFVKGDWKGFGCEFETIVDASGCKVEETGETVVKTQYSTSVRSYSLKVLKVSAK